MSNVKGDPVQMVSRTVATY